MTSPNRFREQLGSSCHSFSRHDPTIYHSNASIFSLSSLGNSVKKRGATILPPSYLNLLACTRCSLFHGNLRIPTRSTVASGWTNKIMLSIKNLRAIYGEIDSALSFFWAQIGSQIGFGNRNPVPFGILSCLDRRHHWDRSPREIDAFQFWNRPFSRFHRRLFDLAF